MEPANLTNSSDDARLAVLVRENLPRLPDDGFSGRVLAALPPPRVRHSAAVEWALAAVGAAAGLAFALGQGVTVDGALRGLSMVGRAVRGVAAGLDTPSLALATVLAAGTLVLGIAAARLRYPGS